MTRFDPTLQAHKDWIGFVRPVGLVVSPRALLDGQAQIDVRAAMEPQRILLALCDPNGSRLSDYARLTTEVLSWRSEDLKTGEVLDELIVALPEFGDSLRPSCAVRDAEEPDQWLLLIQEVIAGESLDDDDTN